MKPGTLLALIVLMLVSCQERSTGWRTGDLIFVSGDVSGTMDQAIMESTGAMVHVGIIEVVGDSIFVIDATPKTGVSRRSWDEFQKAQRNSQGALPAMKLMRLKGQYDVKTSVENANKQCGAPYDFCFLPDNGRYYCSELVYECYVDQGKPLFEAVPMNFRNADGIYDPYWIKLFEEQGMNIPQDSFGTNPDAMYHSHLLYELIILPSFNP